MPPARSEAVWLTQTADRITRMLQSLSACPVPGLPGTEEHPASSTASELIRLHSIEQALPVIRDAMQRLPALAEQMQRMLADSAERLDRYAEPLRSRLDLTEWLFWDSVPPAARASFMAPEGLGEVAAINVTKLPAQHPYATVLPFAQLYQGKFLVLGDPSTHRAVHGSIDPVYAVEDARMLTRNWARAAESRRR